MTPFFKEFNEIAKKKKDIVSKTRAFENSKKEVPIPHELHTQRSDLEGKKYPGTNVEYRRRIFTVNEERIEGVFPKFDSVFETQLPKNMRTASDDVQFKYCTRELAKRVISDPDLKSAFTSRQLEQIKNGEPRISGLTWHHNEIPGKMQLVDAKEHAVCRHTGGRKIWGGGADCR